MFSSSAKVGLNNFLVNFASFIGFVVGCRDLCLYPAKNMIIADYLTHCVTAARHCEVVT